MQSPFKSRNELLCGVEIKSSASGVLHPGSSLITKSLNGYLENFSPAVSYPTAIMV